MSSILKVDTIQDQDGNNIISEAANVITIGASGDTITVPAGATLSGDLNADNLTSGTVPDARITGAYTGITNLTIDTNTGDANNPFVSFDNNDGNIGQVRMSSSGDFGFRANTGGTGNMFFQTGGGSERMRITSTGLVGIGTASPGAKLEIQTSTDWGNIINSTNSGTQYLKQFEYNGSSIGKIRGDNSSIAIESGSNLILQTANTERARLNSTGLGIGTSSPAAKLQVTTASSGIAPHVSADEIAIENSANAGISILSGNSNEGAIYFGDNGDNDIGRIRYSHSSNSMDFLVNASIRATINSAGNVGIGGVPATVNQRLFIEGNNSALIMAEIKNIGGPSALQITANNGTDARVVFGDLADNGRGRIIYSNSDESMQFAVNNLSEKMRIDSSGRLLVGKTAIGDDTVGVEIRGDGLGQFTRSGNKVLMLNRKSSDGAIQEFRKDNTKVGTISCDASQNLTIQGKASSDFSILFGTNKLNPKNYAGTGAKDNAVDLGDNDDRWKDLYLGGGAFLGGTGAANKLEDYEEGTFTPTLNTSTGASLPLNSGIDVMSYTKIGRVVHIQGLIRLASLTNPSGAFFQIIGLPFTTASSSSITQYGGRGGGAIYYDDVGTGKSVLPFTFSEGQTRFNVYKDASTLAVNDDFQIALTYFTN